MSNILTILTPTFNREKELQDLYNSLKNQSCMDFEWVIIDDGSEDLTRDVISNWIKISPFKIRYYYKENGGKHTALNLGIRHIDSELTFIVDSDDRLTFDAVETVICDYKEIAGRIELCGIGYLRGYSENNVIGRKYTGDRFIGNFIQERINNNVYGDKAEVWKTSELKKVPFPEIAGEKFMGENYAWNILAKEKDMLFVNKIIYLTEYLEGGLTKSGRRLRIKCPIGGMINSELLLDKTFNLKNRIKGAILFVTYGKFAGLRLKEILAKTTHKSIVVLCLFPGCVLYINWRHRYLVNQ